VWLSGALAQPFVWGPVQGLAGWREVELAAQAAAPGATGLAGPCVVSLDEWPSAKSVLVVAMDESRVATIVGAAKDARVRLVSMRPWWAGVSEHRSSGEPVLAARDTDALTVLAASADAWQLAHSYLPRPSVEQTRPLLDRLMLAAGFEASAMRHLELARDASNGVWPGVATEVSA
jgi:hypothetical protein